jgi:phosphoserine phosphatase RsbU/P
VDTSALWAAATVQLARVSQLAQTTHLARTMNDAMSAFDASATIYLVDREQTTLRPLSEPDAQVAPIEGTLAGRAFMTLATVQSHGNSSLWTPLVDGSDRLGVVELRLPPAMDATDPGVVSGAADFVRLLGHVLAAKLPYGDELRRVRRSRLMSVTGELLWRMLPPLTFATDNLVLGAIIEPSYELGGDAFDYAVDNDIARIGIFDAVGHDLNANLTVVLTLAAVRAARVAGRDLPAIARNADDALLGHSQRSEFTTAVLADIDMRTGSLRYLNAGHPAPVIVRGRKVVASLSAGRRTPLGISGPADEVAELALEPGDRLLFYTDGIVEARDEEGVPFGLDRLVDFIERQDAAGLPAPETLRRLRHAVLSHQRGRLQDDATLVLVEWGPSVGLQARP